MNNLEEMMEFIEQIESVGFELNEIKDELRQKEFDLKVLRSEMEFSEKYEDFREGLKVKEIPPKILDATIEQAQVLCRLKARRDELEHELYVLKLKFQYIKEVLDSKKI